MKAHIVLLDNFLEASVVELDELGQIMHVGDDVAQILLEQHELFFGRSIGAAIGGRRPLIVEPRDDLGDLPLARGDASADLARLDLLLRVHLLELEGEGVDEELLVLGGPLPTSRPRAIGGHDVGRPQLALEAVVVDVVPLVFLDDARAELLAELHDDLTGLEVVLSVSLVR